MTTSTVIPAKGKVLGASAGGGVIFQPTGTNYELYLVGDASRIPRASSVDVVIRVRARKIFTVPSGGNFIAPILGTPRTIQGHVRAIDGDSMVVHAGVPILVELPADDAAFDLACGPIAIGVMVNVVALPGAGIEFR
jgi:hypothetical protein